jgi:hypothetical protein
MTTFKARVDETGMGQIWLDDIEVTGSVLGFKVESSANKMFNKVTLDLAGPALELDIDIVEVEVQKASTNTTTTRRE